MTMRRAAPALLGFPAIGASVGAGNQFWDIPGRPATMCGIVADRSSAYATFRRRLRAARELAGLSQTQTARRLGRPQSFVSKCESGERRVDVVELRTFAGIYGVDLSFFLGDRRALERPVPGIAESPGEYRERSRTAARRFAATLPAERAALDRRIEAITRSATAAQLAPRDRGELDLLLAHRDFVEQQVAEARAHEAVRPPAGRADPGARRRM